MCYEDRFNGNDDAQCAYCDKWLGITVDKSLIYADTVDGDCYDFCSQQCKKVFFEEWIEEGISGIDLEDAFDRLIIAEDDQRIDCQSFMDN